MESLRLSSEGQLGYLRINCPHQRACVELRSQLLSGSVGIFERFLLRLDSAVSPDGCASVANLTKPVVVPAASQIDVAHFARRSVGDASGPPDVDDSRNLTACSKPAPQLVLYRDFYIKGRPVFVLTRRESVAARAPSEFWLEPLLSLQTGEAVTARGFRNASGWPYVPLRLSLRQSDIRSAAVKRLRQPNRPVPSLRYLHLVDWRLEGRKRLPGFKVDRLRLSTNREVAHIRLMAPNDTAAGAKAAEVLRQQIAANPTLLFDALQFSFAFSPDEAPASSAASSSCEESPVYWVQRRPIVPHLSQFPVSELQRHWQADRPGNESRCRLSMQPQVAKVVSYRGQPLVLWKRQDHPGSHSSQLDDFLIEPIFLLRNDGLEAAFSVGFDYARSAHFVSCRVDLQSDDALALIRRNLTHLDRFRSVAFAMIGNLSIWPTANISGVTAVEFYASYNQRDGFLRLYCDRLAACAGLRNYLSKSSELLLERLQINITMATPDDGCLAPEPIGKLILARRHLVDLAYLREKSPPRLVCAEAAYPRVQAPVQPTGSCQLVLHRSRNLLGGQSLFVEPAFCLDRQPPTLHFDYVRNLPYLSLRMALANDSLLGEVRRGLADSGGTSDTADIPAEDTIDFMELWNLRLRPRTRLPGLEAGDFKVAFDRSEAELRIHCLSGRVCRTLHSNMLQNSTLLLENFNLEITANLPSYDCWMPQLLRKQILSRSASYFDLSYLNGKTRRLPGCPRPLPMRLFSVKSVDGCTAVVHKREDTKAEFYIEPLFCFNGRVELGFNYLTGSPYASLGVDLSRQSVLDTVTAQLANLAPKRVSFLQVRKVNLTRRDLGSEAYQLDSFSASVDRSRGQFRVLCQTWAACRDLSSNLSAQPWLLFERIQLTTFMANVADCELSTAIYQQPTSAASDFRLPLKALRLKLPAVGECPADEAPRLLRILSIDGCPVAVYQQPGELPHQRRLLIEPLLCFHGNNASSSLSRGRDFLSSEEFVSVRLMLRSHGVLAAVQEQLSLSTLEAGSLLRFAELWDVGVAEESTAAGLRVARLGVAADGETAELRVACSSRAACEALVQSLTEEPTDYLRSVLFSVSSLTPSRSCYFKAPAAKRPLIIGYSWDRRCRYDSLAESGGTAKRNASLQLWTVHRCHPDEWTACEVSRSGRSAYFFSRGLSDWADARRTCRSMGADLAVIDSPEENAEVFAHLVGASWIGMYRSGGRFVWVGGPVARSEGYRNFAAGTEQAELDWQFNCVAMSGVSSLSGAGGGGSGGWLPAACHRHLRFVCQYSA
ncbi:hypothetical protein BOX15_Mlig001894g2 [Macrostomum lignano]|uniref:C-type lectin domain-containing protein n=2 Tax=Macrostomum lignano TaxID=282301 RepID=A0A267FWN0_9PLAT|nr:hypothetical protein BOX15_Mlig001894g2 [Macrostomum lignano]